MINIIFYIFIYWLFRYIIVPIIYAILKYKYLIQSNKHIKLIKESGKWAVVTGATDGIGREYCRQLAKIGLNVFLISRDEKKLELGSKELKKCYKIDVMYFQADFMSVSIYERLKEQLQGLDIGVLVNNVGIEQPVPSDFVDIDENFSLSGMININILSAVMMSKIVSKEMCQRKRGIIINISSASSLTPIPLAAVYSSTKSFLTSFSLALSDELSKYRILVQTVRPFYVQTKFIDKLSPPKFLTPTVEEYVESAVKTIGTERSTFGCLNHSIQGIIIGSLPSFLLIKLSKIIYRYFRYVLKRRQ